MMYGSTVLTGEVAVNVINDKPIVDMNGAATGLNNAVSFTEVDGADDASAKVALVASGTNLTDVDSANLSKLEITIPTAGTGGVKAGDQLIITQSGSDKVINLDFTNAVSDPATHMVAFGSTTFSALLSVSSGNQVVTFQPSNDPGSGQALIATSTGAAKAAFEALLDAINYNSSVNGDVSNAGRSLTIDVFDTANASTAVKANVAVTVIPVNDTLLLMLNLSLKVVQLVCCITN